MCGGLMGSARMGRARLVFRDRVGRGVADVPQTLAEVDIVPRFSGICSPPTSSICRKRGRKSDVDHFSDQLHGMRKGT